MAKINDGKFTGVKKTVKTVESVDENTPIVKTEQSNNLQAILDRLNKLEEENKDLKEKVNKDGNPIKNAKEIYKGAKKFNYKLRGEVPVLSYVSERKDKTKDLVYKNEKGIYINNQVLRLALADGTEEVVDSIEFGVNHGRSEKIEAKDENGNSIMAGTIPEYYVFKTKEYGEIKVLPNSIN